MTSPCITLYTVHVTSICRGSGNRCCNRSCRPTFGLFWFLFPSWLLDLLRHTRRAMAASPPLSKSLPDLSTALDELDGLEELPDRPPSPPYSPVPLRAVHLEEFADAWPPHAQTFARSEKEHACPPGPHGLQRPSDGTTERHEGRGEAKGNGPQVLGRERSPSIGSIHSAPELAGPPSPRSGSPERPAFDERDTFASSPPTSPTFPDATPRRTRVSPSPSTLWDYLREEVRANGFEHRGVGTPD